jgi:hypothetical protein
MRARSQHHGMVSGMQRLAGRQQGPHHRVHQPVVHPPNTILSTSSHERWWQQKGAGLTVDGGGAVTTVDG